MPDAPHPNTTGKAQPTCVSCGGTGWWILLKSWFPADGHRRERCGICAGTGLSHYRDDPKFAANQRRLRGAVEGDGDAWPCRHPPGCPRAAAGVWRLILAQG